MTVRNLTIALLALAGAIASALAAVPQQQTLSFGKFGNVTVYRNSPEPSNMVLFVSGDGGWNLGVVNMAKTLASLDATVVGIDITRFLKAQESAKDACAYPAADFEQLSQFVQKKLGYKAFHRPVLVGYSSGATLVYALLGQAPRSTFLGGISLGFCPDLPIKHPWCKGFGLEYSKRPDGKGVDFSAIKTLTEPWYVLQGGQDQVCSPTATAAFVAKVPNGKLVSLPAVGHGFSVERNWMPQFTDAFNQIIASARRPKPLPPIGDRASIPPGASAPDVSSLPLVEVPATGGGSDSIAVLMSGDGGWAGLDREVANGLAAKGIPVVGFDSLSYFWSKRTPDETARAVEATLNRYLKVWNKSRVILVGYSFGGDVFPFVVHRLSGDLQKRVRVLTLIVPSTSAQFEFHVAEWAGVNLGDTLPTLPEMQKAAGIKTLCIYGTEETDSLCPKLTALGAKIIGLPGGHHVGGDYARLVSEIVGASGL